VLQRAFSISKLREIGLFPAERVVTHLHHPELIDWRSRERRVPWVFLGIDQGILSEMCGGQSWDCSTEIIEGNETTDSF
jgi:hypothetical protein